MEDVRWDPRQDRAGLYSLTWKGRDGLTHSAECRGLDISKSGVGLECARELKPGTAVHAQAQDGSYSGDCVVVHCTRRGQKFHLGLEFREEMEDDLRPPVSGSVDPQDCDADYYEILQLSPKADLETVHRVYRIMAARFHPDNPETGNLDEFLRLKRAYATLSDPQRRKEYDATRQGGETGPMPIFELSDFVTGVEAEANRRLGILSLLYNQRRMDPEHPGVSLLDLERRMGFPREYLNFSTWYLRSKSYISVADNSDFALTAEGADYVELNASKSDIFSRLLKPGSPKPAGTGARRPSKRPIHRKMLTAGQPPAN